jgi:hypothetical protein
MSVAAINAHTKAEAAATKLESELIATAKRLVHALDTGAVQPRMANDRAEYEVRWDSEPLWTLTGAIEVMTSYVVDTWFHDIFQAEARVQLQPVYIVPKEDSFSFALSYGATWHEARRHE